MDQFISFAAGSMIAGGTTIVLAIAYWDSIAKINNPLLLWSMILAILLQTEGCFLDGYLFLKATRDFNMDEFYRMRFSALYVNVYKMVLLIFHAAYRALLIFCPRSILLNVISAAAFLGAVILLANLLFLGTGVTYMWQNWKMNHNSSPTAEFTALTYTIIVYDAAMLVLFFGLSQFAIIRCMSSVYNVSVSFPIVAKLVIRCVIYTALTIVVVLFASTVVNWAKFAPFGSGMVFNMFFPMFLSDAGIVRDIVDHFNNSRGRTGNVSTAVRSQMATGKSIAP
ncbi:hypothetical protein DFJ73DRAFT_858541 [Zopfochytrium polystomum]|nr:hypothetical protein DFJ73DRAFT_858541 [Zopfochytrium polystomum]